VAIRPDGVRVFAPAKINLFLHVIGRRADGFHDLQSLVAFADIGDVLHAARDDALSLTIEGPFADGLAAEADNLVLRAARAAGARLGVTGGARFRLTKNLPVASGIGGGSADAAAALRAMLALHGDIAHAELLDIAAFLGSDIPVCVASGAALMEGRGERVSALPPLPQTPILLVNPGVSVATADVFRGLANKNNPPATMPSPFASFDDLVGFLRTTRNDLEAPARNVAPVIGEVLAALSREGAAFTRMSGSGATCFGLFASPADATHAADAIARAQPGWWSKAGVLA
jgi:4-diphosphocytidyl-2-C-methyl-D-erythritol kinase